MTLPAFQGHALDPELSLRRGLRSLSGATLTGNALLDASRRGLALWRQFYGNQAGLGVARGLIRWMR